jgi:methylmalonyl-CoA mutase, C-terminal domain
MNKDQKIRVLVAKPGLDGHDRGAKVVARALRDAGMEVIYTGIRQTPEMIVKAAVQESVDVVGLSILSGAHLQIFPTIIKGLKDAGIDALVIAGGIIPDDDVKPLNKMGVKGVFPPGTPTGDIVKFIQKECGAVAK